MSEILADVIDELNVVPTQDQAFLDVPKSTAVTTAAHSHPVELRYGYFRQLLVVGVPLWLSDTIATLVALCASFGLTSWLGNPLNYFVPFAGCCTVAYSLCLWSAGLYPGVGIHPARELKQMFRASLTATLALAMGLLLVSDLASPYLWMVCFTLPMQLVLLPPSRSLTKHWMRRNNLGVPFYFLGKREDALRVFEDMSRFGWSMLLPAGRFQKLDDTSDYFHAPSQDCFSDVELRFEREMTYRGTSEDILPTASRESVFWLFVSEERNALRQPGFSQQISKQFPEVVLLHPSQSYANAGGSVLSCGLVSGVRVEESLLLPWPKFQKRFVDILVSATGLICLSPILLLVAALIRFSGPGPIFYGSTRIGKDGKKFKAWKFRSMVRNANTILAKYLAEHPELAEEYRVHHKLKHDPRITLIGRILRKTSFDEIPQLWNVLVGEMSLVGPRPILPDELHKFEQALSDYVRVRPGITGLWQVSGRNKTEYSERLTYTSFYVRQWSPWLDIYILLRTVRTVIFCEGAY